MPGQYTFNFNFKLPLKIPSSFSHTYGNIKYSINVEIERSLRFNKSFEFPFNVVTHLDLNQERDELKKPLMEAIKKSFFLSSSELQLTAEINCQCYVPGETLHTTVNLVNQTSVEVEEIVVELRRKCIFKVANSSSKLTDDQLLVKGNHKVDANAKAQMTFSMQIPPVGTTDISFSKYILISYELSIIAKVGMLHRNAVLKLPLTIGTVPLVAMDAPTSSGDCCGMTNEYTYAVNSDNQVVQIPEASKK